MNYSNDVKRDVMNWYSETWNKPVFPLFKRPELTPETSLSTGKYPWSSDDAMDILDDYFNRFNVNREFFVFSNYWPNEEVFMPLNFLRSRKNKWKWIEPQALTLEMLVESAKAGYWIYE